jgi:hypothetical protein
VPASASRVGQMLLPFVPGNADLGGLLDSSSNRMLSPIVSVSENRSGTQN